VICAEFEFMEGGGSDPEGEVGNISSSHLLKIKASRFQIGFEGVKHGSTGLGEEGAMRGMKGGEGHAIRKRIGVFVGEKEVNVFREIREHGGEILFEHEDGDRWKNVESVGEALQLRDRIP
jgi:hypothetical protein